MEKMYKIRVCARVNLFVSNYGFAFQHAHSNPPDAWDRNEFHAWSVWEYHYPPYLSDDLVNKVYAFCDTLTEREKLGAMYQGLIFKAKNDNVPAPI